jgi:WD40 repeat protein
MRVPTFCLALLVFFASLSGAADKLDPAVEKLKEAVDNKTGDRDKVRQEILTFVHSKAGTPAAMQASDLLTQLPSPLDHLDPKQIPVLDRFDWQPKELVAVLGEHRLRHGHPVTCVVYSKDGKRVISGGTNYLVRIWDTTTMRQQAITSTGYYTTCLAISDDCKTLAAGTVYGLLHVWDISGEKPVETGRFNIGTSTVHSVDISKDNKILAAGVYDGLVHTFDLDGSKPKERTQLSGHKTAVRAVQFTPDSHTLAAGAADGTIRFWSFQSKEKINELGSLPAHTAALSSMCFTSRGGQLIAGCDDGHIVRVTMGAKFTKGAFFKSPAAVTAVAMSPGGFLTSSHSDGVVRVWGATTVPMPKPTMTAEGHYGSVVGFAYSHDGRRMVTGGSDWTVRLWNTAPKMAEVFALRGHWSRVNSNNFAPDGASLATGSEDRTARVWNLSKAAPVQTAQLNKDNVAVYTVVHSPDGKLLAVGGANTVAHLWDLAKRSELRSFSGHPSSVNQLFFTPDGKQLLASSHKHVVLWNANTAREMYRFEGHEQQVNSMTMSPDGRFVLTGTGYYQYKDGKIVTIKGEYQYTDCTIRLWDVRDGRLKKDITNLEKPVSNLTFSPDGRTFACGMWYKPSSLWQASIEALTKKAEVKNTSVWSHQHAFSPDGKRLVTLGNDGKLRLTDVASDKVLKDWVLGETIAHFTFSPDNRYLAVSIITGPVYILRLEEPPAAVSGK